MRQRLPALVTGAVLVSSMLLATGGVALAQGPVATNPRFCEGTRIVFFPGGAPGGSFETVVYNGAQAAAAAFGADVTYQWSEWDIQKMITQFGEAVATNPDGTTTGEERTFTTPPAPVPQIDLAVTQSLTPSSSVSVNPSLRQAMAVTVAARRSMPYWCSSSLASRRNSSGAMPSRVR